MCAGEGLEAGEVLDRLTALVEKSLVVYEEQAGEARYRLLETAREYSWDRLLEAGSEGSSANATASCSDSARQTHLAPLGVCPHAAANPGSGPRRCRQPLPVSIRSHETEEDS